VTGPVLRNFLADLAERIGEHVGRYRRATLTAAESVLEAGRLLVETRAECRHGEWLGFLERAGLADRTARNWMRLARSGLDAPNIVTAGGVRAALLTYGAFDLRGTPSMRAFGDLPMILNTSSIEWFVDLFARGQDLEDPDISPIWSDLRGLPPALFTVGALDPLLDDSLFMAARWKAAGSPASLDVWPGALHAFDLYDNAYGRSARNRMHEFLNAVLDEAR